MFNSQLEKWGVIQYIDLESKMDQIEFSQKMKNHVDPFRFGLFNRNTNFWKNRKNRLCGEIHPSGFKVMFYSSNKSSRSNMRTIAKGSIVQKANNLKVDVKIGFSMFWFWISPIWFILISIWMITLIVNHNENVGLSLGIILPVLSCFGFFLYRNIRRLEIYTSELREFLDKLFSEIESGSIDN